jgi:hypothetical protein
LNPQITQIYTDLQAVDDDSFFTQMVIKFIFAIRCLILLYLCNLWTTAFSRFMDMLKNIFLRKPYPGNQEYSAQGEAMPHPAVQIYIWLCLILAVQMLGAYAVVMLAGILIVFSFRICASRFFFLLRRTRWVLFSVFLIYAYTSPGESLWPHLGVLSPVAEGVEYGLLQLLHLLAVLAGLSILLTLLSQQQLIAGLYTLSRPLSLLGVPRERFAVRLALTLHYAESAMQDTASNWRGSIEQLLAQLPLTPGYIELQLVPFTRRDGLLTATVSAALLGIWLSGGVWL